MIECRVQIFNFKKVMHFQKFFAVLPIYYLLYTLQRNEEVNAHLNLIFMSVRQLMAQAGKHSC